MSKTITCPKCKGEGILRESGHTTGVKCPECNGEGRLVERVTESGVQRTKILNE